MAENSIVIRQGQAQRVQIEKLAAAAFYPGHLLELDSNNELKKHATAGGAVTPIIFALEDENQGNGIDDAYAADDRVVGWIPQRGDWVLAILADGETAVIGSRLQSGGDGTLKVQTDFSDSINAQTVCIAMEAMDLSDSSGAETADTALGYDKRIWVMAI